MLKSLWKRFGPNPFDRLLKKAAVKGVKNILIPWNRGLGDIALGLYAMVYRIRTFIPDAKITFLTRPNLEEGFRLLKDVDVLIEPSWKRGNPYTISIDTSLYDLVIENANPTAWVAWQRGVLTPKLRWNPEWDALCDRFGLPQGCIGAHVHCETGYYHERNWPEKYWQELFASLQRPVVLFGFNKYPLITGPHIFDLRGELSLHEMLSIIKNKCSTLIVPDSGVLGITYYLDVAFPLRVVSLWADPNHGVLKQNVASPNPLLQHYPLISPSRKNAALISVEKVREAL